MARPKSASLCLSLLKGPGIPRELLHKVPSHRFSITQAFGGGALAGLKGFLPSSLFPAHFSMIHMGPMRERLSPGRVQQSSVEVTAVRLLCHAHCIFFGARDGVDQGDIRSLERWAQSTHTERVRSCCERCVSVCVCVLERMGLSVARLGQIITVGVGSFFFLRPTLSFLNGPLCSFGFCPTLALISSSE